MRTTSKLLPFCLLLTLLLPIDSFSDTPQLAGTWTGTWTSYDTETGGLTVIISQNGNNLSGTMTLTNTPVGTVSASFSGSISGVVFDIDASFYYQGSLNTIQLDGTFYSVQNSMSGIYVMTSLVEDSGTFTLSRSAPAKEMIGALENPLQGQTVSGITTIHGWGLDELGIAKVELFLDGLYGADIPYGGTRKDVQYVYPDYPNADKSGFAMVINYSILTPGNHAVKVRLHNSSGQTKDLDASVIVKKCHGEYITNVSPNGIWLTNYAVTVGGNTLYYDFKIDWSSATQSFEITEVIQK